MGCRQCIYLRDPFLGVVLLWVMNELRYEPGEANGRIRALRHHEKPDPSEKRKASQDTEYDIALAIRNQNRNVLPLFELIQWNKIIGPQFIDLLVWI